MLNSNIEKILDMYKNGNVNVTEASKLLSAIGVEEQVEATDSTYRSSNTPWEDDGKLRIVVFKGKNLLTVGEANKLSIDITYRGDALDVDCMGNLRCSDIEGNANAGGNIMCSDIEGNVIAGGDITCSDIEGDARAGGNIKCGDIEGNVTAGGNVIH